VCVCVCVLVVLTNDANSMDGTFLHLAQGGEREPNTFFFGTLFKNRIGSSENRLSS